MLSAFGVRRLDPTERHQGMMTAVAVESLVKLCTFLFAGIFVTYFLFNGMDDIFQRFSETPFSGRQTIGPEGASSFMLWMTYLILAMSGMLFLPRQFHVAVIENSNEKHILTAMWLFPLYLFLINIFVLPIAMAGLIKGFPIGTADTFVLRMPLAFGKPWLALLVFLGGFSAAMSMIMVSSMTMATMITNHLLLPSLINSGWLSSDLLLYGPWGIGLLRPEALMGVTAMDPLSHGVFWSLLVNIGLYVSGSLVFEKNADADKVLSEFIDLLTPDAVHPPPVLKEPSISMQEKLPQIIRMLSQYMPRANAWAVILKSLDAQGITEKSLITVLEMAEFCGRVKKILAGSIGTAEAHKAFEKAAVFTPEEQVELTAAYGQILASLALTPEELYLKIDFYRERDKLISEHAEELEEKVVALQQEIAERLRAEQALKTSEDKYRALVENATDAIVIIQDRNIVFSNPAALKLMGYSAAEFQGMSFTELIHPDERETADSRYRGRLDGTLGPGLVEYRFIGKNENIMTVLVSSMKINWEDRPALLFIARDITEQKKLEAQLLQSQKLEALGTLAGGVAHDFNNLLMGLQGNISIMLHHLDPRQPNFKRLKNMEEYISDAARLTYQLLGLARKGKYEIRTIDMNELIMKTASMFGRAKKELTIITGLNVVPPVDADKVQIELVLLNLFVNAWQAMPGGGALSVATETTELAETDVRPHDLNPGTYVKISVTDTGVGMDPETQKKVFDPFFTTKAMGRGTGLGLSSAYGIIKNHNGFITIVSQPGKGTTFNVFLPASGKAVSPESKPSQGMLAGRETILLVDDEAMVLEVGAEMLGMMGYNVLTASNGKTAETIFKENKDEIALVVLDMIMPEISGSMVYDRVKAIDPEVKVLLSSGYSFNEQAAEILKKGCNGFIQKPFDVKSLSHKVREILENKINRPNGMDATS